ncbi:MAG TPA: hypothetical protein VMU24_02015 [Candidatus Acidoferrales bacterium]|nr:hypothetical protein [Candidatus Acidoferrales bacterium]
MVDAVPRLSIRNLLVKTFFIYQQRLSYFVGLSLIGPLVATASPLLLWLYHTNGGIHREPPLSWLPLTLGTLLATTLMLLGAMVSSAAVAQSLAASEKLVEALLVQSWVRTRFWSVLGIICSVLLRMLGAGAIFMLMGMAVLAGAAALGFNSQRVAGAIGYSVAFGWLLATILSGIRIYSRDCVAIQSCVIEDIGRKAALNRSAFLTTGNRGRVALLYSAFMVLSCAIVLGQLLLMSRGYGTLMWVLETGIALVAGALTTPFWTIGTALIYFEERKQRLAIAAALYNSRNSH